MFCQKCGKSIPDGSPFCPECGAAQNLAGQQAQQPVPQAKAKKSVFKKWWFWVLAVVVVIIIVAAITGGDDTTNPVPTTGASPATSESSEPTSPSTEQEAGTGTLGDYSVTISGYTLTTDYEGKPAVVITYNWTNNSDEATSYAVAMNSQVFQNDIECDIAIVMDNSVYSADNYMKEIKPGASLDVQLAYVLQDSTNPIDVEVSELISFSDKMVTQTYDITK